jgi:hypothetical protein
MGKYSIVIAKISLYLHFFWEVIKGIYFRINDGDFIDLSPEVRDSGNIYLEEYDTAIKNDDFEKVSEMLENEMCKGSDCSVDVFNEIVMNYNIGVFELLLKNKFPVKKLTVENFRKLVHPRHIFSVIETFLQFGYPASACDKYSFDSSITAKSFVFIILLKYGYPLDDITVEDFDKMVLIGIDKLSLKILMKKFSIHSITTKTFDRLIQNAIENEYDYKVKLILDNGYYPGRCSPEQYRRCVDHYVNTGDCSVLHLLNEKSGIFSNILYTVLSLLASFF